MRTLKSYDESRLWARLDELSLSDGVDRAAVDHLKASVHKIADNTTRFLKSTKSTPKNE